MKNLFFALFLLIGYNSCYSQTIRVNEFIDTSVFKNFKEPLDLWLDFLNAESDSSASKYWNNEEIEKYGKHLYFFVRNGIECPIDFHEALDRLNISVLSIGVKENVFQIKSSISMRPKDSTTSRVLGVFTIHAKKEYGELKLYNALVQNTKDYCNSTTVGYINFHYPKSHVFNKELAKKQSDFYLKFSQDFDVPIDTVDYYFTANNEELQRLKGYDFLWGEINNDIPSGVANVQRKNVYTQGLGEYYPHELIHILITPVYYETCHSWFDEGLSTYYGGSRGKELDWHLKRLTIHLNAHPEIDLDSMLNLNAMDVYTNFSYSLGGFFMKKAFEKGGITLQKKFLIAGSGDSDFYSSIEKHLGIKQENLNEVIRKELNELYLEK